MVLNEDEVEGRRAEELKGLSFIPCNSYITATVLQYVL